MGRGCQLQQLGPKAPALGQELPWLVPPKSSQRALPWGEACRAPSPQPTRAPPVGRWSSGETASPEEAVARESGCRVSVPGSAGLGPGPHLWPASNPEWKCGAPGVRARRGVRSAWVHAPLGLTASCSRQDCVPCLKTGLNGLRSKSSGCPRPREHELWKVQSGQERLEVTHSTPGRAGPGPRGGRARHKAVHSDSSPGPPQGRRPSTGQEEPPVRATAVSVHHQRAEEGLGPHPLRLQTGPDARSRLGWTPGPQPAYVQVPGGADPGPSLRVHRGATKGP